MPSAQHNDPKLLYAISGVSAYHIDNGREKSLTPDGPQTLSLLMVPTSSSPADPARTKHGAAADQDFYLHLHLPPELDLPMPATTQIYHQPPASYLIPRWDLGRDCRAFTRIEFPSTGSRKHLQEDIDTFETILAQCTAFLERAPPPKTGVSPSEEVRSPGKVSSKSEKRESTLSATTPSKEDLPPYNPGDFKPGEAYAPGSTSHYRAGQIVLVDEEDGHIVGELGESFNIVEDPSLKPGSKDPVQITLPADGSQNISVAPARRTSYEERELHPAYKRSTLVSNAWAASHLIVTTSDKVSDMLYTQADNFTKNTKPAAKPLTFKPATKERVRRINSFTESAAGLSAKTVGQISHIAQNVGASLARKGGSSSKRGYDKDGKPVDFKPGLLNKSLMAFSTVADGIEQAGRNLLFSTSSAATTMVAHRWGEEAGELSRGLSGGVRNVALVYIDVTGVSRRAVIKSVAKGMVVGRTTDGGKVMVSDLDGGIVAVPDDIKASSTHPNGTHSRASSVSGVDLKKEKKQAGYTYS